MHKKLFNTFYFLQLKKNNILQDLKKNLKLLKTKLKLRQEATINETLSKAVNKLIANCRYSEFIFTYS